MATSALRQVMRGALARMTDEFIEFGISLCGESGIKIMKTVEERAGAFFYPLEIFERFWWPYTRRIVDAFWSEGITTSFHLDTCWDKNIHYFKELPRGSAIVELQLSEGGKSRRLVFSGDIGRPDIPIIRDPEPINGGCDILIMESTYGNRANPPYPESEQELERIVNETVHRGGSLLVPAFAVGRTQQIVYALHKLHTAGRIPDLPIFVDSPLASRTTEIFRLHPEVYDNEIRDFLLSDDDNNPFGFGRLQYTQSVEQSKALNRLGVPAVIISSSGMLEGGRILHHLRNRIGDPRNTILMTSWQAPNTLGRQLAEKAQTVRIFGDEFKVRARVVSLTGFSGHADRNGLIQFARVMQKRPQQTFIVHGEQDSAESLAEGLRNELGFKQVYIPEPMQTFKT